MTVKWNEYLIEQFPVTEYADVDLHYFHKLQDIPATVSLTYILVWHSGCPHLAWALILSITGISHQLK